MPDMSRLRDAIKARGTANVAAALGVSMQRVCNWMTRGVPIEYCAPLEVALDGAVTRKDLRPDDWQQIWPELAEERANDV